MNKESIYQIIGYSGEFNDKVKRNLRKLLKDYHPDHDGDVKIFELINEVKKELEEDKVSIKYKKKINVNNYDGVDYDYCEQMQSELVRKNNNLNKELLEKKILMEHLEKEYRNLYNDSLKKKNDILNLEQYKKIFSKIKRKCIFLLFLLVIVFIYSIIKKNIITLILFFILAFLLIYEMKEFFITLNNVKKEKEIKLKEYFNVFKNIRDNTDKKVDEEKKILEMEQQYNINNNDIRFYNNILKHK